MSRRIAERYMCTIMQRWSLCRVLPELKRAAKSIPANMYIAHDLGALPAAVSAAAKHKAFVGFDAEDFYSGMCPLRTLPSVTEQVTEYVERHYLPRCDYMTAASSAIAEAYAIKYAMPKPVTVLNVFPLSQRPPAFRPAKASDPLTLYGFSQTIGANRGLEDVLQAMSALRGYRIELHLRGLWQRGYREQLLRFAALLGLKAEQITVHSPAPPDDMTRLASGFEIGLALEPGRDTNNRIAVSNKLFTYLLAGNAVIATATRGQRPIIEAIGGAGFCYEPGDVETLAHRLHRWCVDRTSLEAARQHAWDWGSKRYNWDVEKENFLHALESVQFLKSKQDRVRRKC
jgi:glycosyltransferase involved in cell wall biosynthesis